MLKKPNISRPECPESDMVIQVKSSVLNIGFKWLIYRLNKERKIKVAGNYECKELDRINSVQSSIKYVVGKR